MVSHLYFGIVFVWMFLSKIFEKLSEIFLSKVIFPNLFHSKVFYFNVM